MELFLNLDQFKGGAIRSDGTLNVKLTSFINNRAYYVSQTAQRTNHSLTKELPLPFYILPWDMELFGSLLVLIGWSYLQ